ncbi:ejaculatory bulb-specific protein 3-like [Schistocerca nitens]|uniref:ejaculatory bulb-specific protein 3-like n=1 Tax=Schistocerca nitens TaxID=7011 RepID=UPI0021175896|nr:ejaculatory bulb-specific protein 3-like [Schistocerca nitens]
MQNLVLFVTLLAVASGCNTQSETINVHQLLHNERKLLEYHRCLLSDSNDACTDEGKELKSVLPDALKTDCGQCNEKQKAQAKAAITLLASEKPQLWNSLIDKYDPDGSYRQRHAAELAKLSS